MNVCAILVTYHPCKKQVQDVFSSVVSQVEHIVVVDNSPEDQVDALSVFEHDKCTLLKNGNNIGLSKAQNIGIQWAIADGYDYVLLLDQDSAPAADMVEKLVDASERLKGQGIKLASVGPRYIDERNIGHASFSKLSGFRVIKYPASQDGIVNVDFLISSGSLISVKLFEQIGLMDEGLFIDQIDIEWGLRAKSMGYHLFGVGDALMRHSLGEDPITICGRKILNHGPLRHYYIFRNATWLISKKYTPLGWRIYFIRMMVIRLLLYSLFIAPRRLFFVMMLRGVLHGVSNTMGKLNIQEDKLF